MTFIRFNRPSSEPYVKLCMAFDRPLVAQTTCAYHSSSILWHPYLGFSAFVSVSKPIKSETISPISAGRCCSTSLSVFGIG